MKRASEMTEAERAERLAELKRGPKPEPMDMSKKAKDQTEAERTAWLREYARRLG
jgi:hypothetical protein